MKRLRDRCIVWSAYFDVDKGRSEGRRIPRRLALPSPTIGEIVEAAKRLDLNPQVNSEAYYPRGRWLRRGHVVVDKFGSKVKTLTALAEGIIRHRNDGKSASRKV